MCEKIRCLDSNQEMPEISVLASIRFIKQSWDEVTTTTIANCFRHAGFSGDNFTCEHLDLIDQDFLAMCTRLEVDCQAYVDVDKDLEAAAILTDEEIVDLLLNENEFDNEVENESGDVDKNENNVNIVNKSTALFYISQLKDYFLFSKNDNSESVEALYKIENNLLLDSNTHQSTIISFLNN